MEDNVEFWIVVASILFGAGSEIIGLSKWKPNSWVQLIIKVVGTVLKRSAKREKDETVSREGG